MYAEWNEKKNSASAILKYAKLFLVLKKSNIMEGNF